MSRTTRTRPDLIAHRGASGYRPEHTLAAYRLALALGADGVELDLVATRDGVLAARHEPELSVTTDIATRSEFAHLRTTKLVDGKQIEGWFVDDLTLAELKTLRARERMGHVRPDNVRFDGCYEVPTFAEVLQLVDEEGRRLGRTLQVYAELKHATYFAAADLPLDQLFGDELRRSGALAPVTVMAFEGGVLRRLRRVGDLPLVQLVDRGGMPYDRAIIGDLLTYREMVTPGGLVRVAEYADGIGLAKSMVLPHRVSNFKAVGLTRVIDDAHAAGLDAVVWTLRDENDFMATCFRHGAEPFSRGDSVAEYQAFLGAGADVIMGDHPDTAVEARRRWLPQQSPLVAVG